MTAQASLDKSFHLLFHQTLFTQSLILPYIADILDKFAKLYAVKFIAMQFCLTLAMPKFCQLQYTFYK